LVCVLNFYKLVRVYEFQKFFEGWEAYVLYTDD
jgi:hypothetical protein